MIRLGKFLCDIDPDRNEYEITNISERKVTVEWTSRGTLHQTTYDEDAASRYFSGGTWHYIDDDSEQPVVASVEPVCKCEVVSAHDIDCAWMAWRNNRK